jgi:hypothetical protein
MACVYIDQENFKSVPGGSHVKITRDWRLFVSGSGRVGECPNIENA